VKKSLFVAGVLAACVAHSQVVTYTFDVFFSGVGAQGPTLVRLPTRRHYGRFLYWRRGCIEWSIRRKADGRQHGVELYTARRNINGPTNESAARTDGARRRLMNGETYSINSDRLDNWTALRAIRMNAERVDWVPTSHDRSASRTIRASIT
jgi:hypothetical protein